jgi:DNA-directed RNA polymerase specialized sigma24 family protein
MMPGCGSTPDNSPDDLAYVWAQCEEQKQADQLFEALVRAVEAELLTSARTMAYRIVRDNNDVDDAINAVWVKILEKRKSTTGVGPVGPSTMTEQTDDQGSPGQKPSGFDPSRASFSTYFFTVLRSTCIDIWRRRHAGPQPFADVTIYEDRTLDALTPEGDGPEGEILKKIESIEERITAAIEVLDFSDGHRDMLRLMLEPEDAIPPVDHKAAVAARKQKERLRDKVAKLADLTAEELEAVLLVRKHHAAAAAAAAAPGVEVQRLFASAKRKVAALFGIETEGLT